MTFRCTHLCDLRNYVGLRGREGGIRPPYVICKGCEVKIPKRDVTFDKISRPRCPCCGGMLFISNGKPYGSIAELVKKYNLPKVGNLWPHVYPHLTY